MNLSTFKKELEKSLSIIEWSPTNDQLLEIAKRLSNFRGTPSKPNIEEIVLQVVGSYKALLLKGVDSSDLTTLLILATKTAQKP